MRKSPLIETFRLCSWLVMTSHATLFATPFDLSMLLAAPRSDGPLSEIQKEIDFSSLQLLKPQISYRMHRYMVMLALVVSFLSTDPSGD
ncbi:hypothetical protein H5410_052359 [Solanum commersonii]|uniref:Uncharacterized protein n=1 Tax=Solanum commersonii TaxID=4109 RepID=A0A9J5X367_SOLCO|nr:hypothetical protein H5410_052359 [Solanum commersonii]